MKPNAVHSGRHILDRARDLLERAQKGTRMLREYMEIVGNGGRPFEPLTYDFDSLDNRDPAAIARVLSSIAEPMERYFDAEVRGLERIPEGGTLYVGNHSGGAFSPEVFLFGAAMYRRNGLRGLPYGLAHESVAKVAPAGRLLIPVGAVRACHENAARIFERGHSVLVYPGGDEDAFRPTRKRDRIVFAGRRGYVRLALRHGVPITPVVTAGAHDVFVVLTDGRWLSERLPLSKSTRFKVFPIVASLPWGLSVGLPLPFIPLPARVRIEVLEPIRFERSGETAALDVGYVESCHARVERTMQRALSRLARGLRGTQLEQAELGAVEPDNDQLTTAHRDVA